MHLLLAEDDKISRDLLRRIVESEGNTVVLASDGEQAWQHLTSDERPFDAAIFDICMPGAGGLDVLERLRSREELRHMPIILCSAVSDRTTVQRAASLAVTHYVVKPYSRAVMLEKLRRIRESLVDASEMEAVEVVCQRLGIDAGTHKEMLGSVIEDSALWVRDARATKERDGVQALFVRGRGLKGSCLSMGAKGLAGRMETVETALQSVLDQPGPPYPEISLEHLESLLVEVERQMETVRQRRTLVV